MYQNVIPLSDGESSDEEVFQTFLQANNVNIRQWNFHQVARSLPFAPPAPYTRGAYMHSTVYAWCRIHVALYTHGAIYAWSCICMEPYTCGASSLPLLPACSPCSLSIPGSLELSWGLRKPPAHSPHFQLAPLAPWASLGHGTSLRPQEAPSSLPACSPCSLSIPGSLELPSLPAGSSSLTTGSQWPMMLNMYWYPHHLWVTRG